jgi:hypothetical protein
MKRKPFQVALGLEWLVIPIVALRYWSVWERLPWRLATHFNDAGQPNVWMTREASLWFMLGILGFVLAIFTLVVYLAYKTGPKAIAWGILAFSYFVSGFIAMANEAVLKYNLTGQPIHLAPFMWAIPVPVAILVIVIVRSQRGSELPSGKTIAEEVHGSFGWGIGFVVLGVAAALVWANVHGGARIPLGVVAVVLLLVGAAAWSGFHYYFTQHGVEVRALGFRLRSIPLQQVQRYAIDRWNAIGGYGIRGGGNACAYVWGSKGMKITTNAGWVFLGHNEPERLVRDMDRVMKSVKA